MKNKKILLVLMITLSACASASFGQRKVEYSKLNIALGFSGTSSLNLVVLDNRQMVVDKSQGENFTGYMRSTVGIAWPIKTKSGKPLADDFGSCMARALQANGFKTTHVSVAPAEHVEKILQQVGSSDAERTILITLNKWNTDGYVKQWLDYDIDFSIYDAGKQALISKKFTAVAKPLGGTVMWGAGKYKVYMPKATEEEWSSIFNDAELVALMK